MDHNEAVRKFEHVTLKRADQAHEAAIELEALFALLPKEIGIVGHFGWHTFRHTYATLLKGNSKDMEVVPELMRHANISVTLNIYAQAITQTKRDAQSRVVSLLLDKNEEKPSTEAYRNVTDLQNSGGGLQVVD
jgi:integrase